MSDRARKEFSNSTLMLWLSKYDSKFRLPGEWGFTELEHGKSDYDGLGAGIKKKLCFQYLWKHTKGVPMRGKYAKYKEYRFKTLLATGDVKYRHLPCFCAMCLAQRYALCKN